MKDTNKEMVFNNETVDMKALGELLEDLWDLRLKEDCKWFEEELKEEDNEQKGNKS